MIFSAFIQPSPKVVLLKIMRGRMKNPSGFNDHISASYHLKELGFFSAFATVQTGNRSKKVEQEFDFFFFFNHHKPSIKVKVLIGRRGKVGRTMGEEIGEY